MEGQNLKFMAIKCKGELRTKEDKRQNKIENFHPFTESQLLK